MKFIREQLRASSKVKREMRDECAEQILQAARVISTSLTMGGKVLLCGNGGSAADCQHIATELVVKLGMERPGMPAVALTTDSSLLTAISNDFSYEEVFYRQVETLGGNDDVLIAISTSGDSANVINAIGAARTRGMKVIALLGRTDGKMAGLADVDINIPSGDTQRIQEGHITVGHIICDLVEKELFG